MPKLRAFSLVELTVAVSIVGVLASVITINYVSAKRAARDTNLASGARILVQAISSYQQVKGTTFVTSPDGPCVVSDPSGGSVPASGAGCVGMDGFASGRANGSTKLFGLAAVGDPAPGRVYTPTSIVEALKKGGFLRQDVTHPLATNLDDPRSPDLYVVHAGRDYLQSISGSAQIVTVAYAQENPTTLEQNQRSTDYFGAFDTATGPVDFGAWSTDLQNRVVLVSNDTVRNVCSL